MTRLGCLGLALVVGGWSALRASPALGGVTPEHEATIADEALVQIFILGLGVVWKEESARIRELDRLEVYFPSVAGHTIELRRGLPNTGDRELLDPLRGEEARVLLAGNVTQEGLFQQIRPRFHPTLPTRQSSDDARWILGARQVDSRVSLFLPPDDGCVVRFDTGTLETCGLVHGTNGEACGTVAMGHTRRPGSEYLVVRAKVEKTRDGYPTLWVEKGADSYPVPPMALEGCDADSPERCVEWEGEIFGTVYDIFFENLSDEATFAPPTEEARKRPDSRHGREFLYPLFSRTSGAWRDWTIRTGRCDLDVQPPCLHYLLERYFGMPTGPNGAVCPMVGYP